MPRPPATAASEQRVSRLVDVLFDGAEANGETPAVLADRSGLRHETIRRLWRHAGGRPRSGPGFFVVAAIARARGVSLDLLAHEAMNQGVDGTSDG